MPAEAIWIQRLNRVGATNGPLHGRSFAVKDLFDIQGERRGCGNPHWRQRQPPSGSNATAVQQLLDAGAICFGSTTMDEFAFGLSGESPWTGCPPNSAAPGCITGGSSSGSAAAVAETSVDLALGSDTGGSIRVPASWCGLLGWRPSHRSVSTQGMQPLAPTLDTTGLFCRDHKLLLGAADVLLSSSSNDRPSEPHAPERLYWIPELWTGVKHATRTVLLDACEQLRHTIGCNLETITLSQLGLCEPQDLQTLFQAIQWDEIAATFATLPEDLPLGAVFQRNLAMVQNRARSEKIQLNQHRDRVRDALASALGDHGLLAQPITPGPAPAIGSFSLARSQGSLMGQLILLNALAGLSGAPELSIPTGGVDNKPLGLGLIASPGRDRLLLQTLQMCRGSLAQNGTDE